MSPVLDGFHFAVREWFERRFGQPSRAQELGWPAIGAGSDVLICAPTGSGKTLAAFMWSINRLVREAENGSLRDEVSVLYVSPLKALANDIRLNLEEPLEDVRVAAAEHRLDLAEIRAGLRTGDTAAHERGAMLRRPPHILVTTPESLFILLTSPRFREKLCAVRYVIVDELHALAGNKRGAHLALTLERLERTVRNSGASRPTRIGLSATLNPIEELAAFLAGGEIVRTPEADASRTQTQRKRRQRPFRIVRADDRPRAMDLKIIAPGPELGPLATHQHWDAAYDRIAELVREHRTTLVFTLSRRLAERVALNLQKRLGADAVMAHHGSLGRRERFDAEQRLKRGELKALVATASLELGIDVGAVDLVCQIDSPKSISAAIQRIGRSGHALGATPKGRLFALTLDDLIECAAAVRAIRGGRLDAVEIPSGCLDVAAQQIVAIAAEDGEIGEADLLDVLRGAHTFADLAAADFRRLLEELAAEVGGASGRTHPKIFYDRTGRRVRARRGARLAAITSGGTIPENGNYDVVIESQGRKIGDIEEDFAQESSRGDVFALGSMPWQIQRISRGRLMVEAAPGMAPTLPFWLNEGAGRTVALSAEVCELRREVASRLDDPALAQWLDDECALDAPAAAQAIAYVRRGLAALGTIPDEHMLVAERFFDGLGGTQIVIHAPFGMRVNRALGLALRKRLCQSFDFEIQASAIDDGVLLALNARHSFPLEAIFTMINARTVREVLTQALLDAPMFEARFRHVATRALSVMRNSRGRKVPAWIQRLRAQDLMIALFPQQQACFENRPVKVEIPNHFIVRETIRECLEESTDLRRLVRLMEGIESGAVRTRAVDSVAPSVFAHRLLLAWDYAFLDDGERANRRSRAVAMNRGMAEDVFRSEDLSQMLAADAVELTSAEAAGTAPSRRARDRDELYEMIRAHGALAAHQLADRVAGDAGAMLAALESERRITRVRYTSGASERLIVTEDVALFAAAYPAIVFAETPADAVSHHDYSQEAAQEEIVRRALKTSGPTTGSELAKLLELRAADIVRSLAALEASGEIFRGHFTSADHEQWCERGNLEKIHRMTLARLRAEIEPCDDHEFAAFRLRWHHIGGADLAQGAEGVATVLEQLEGMAFAPDLWESAILPARVPGYRREFLDQLCVGGQFVWAAFPRQESEDVLPSSVAFFDRRHRVPWSANGDPAVLEAKDQSVWQALVEGGAQYLDQLSDRAGVSERDALKSLWRLAALGLATNDSFAPLRLLSSSADARRAIDGPQLQALSKRDANLRARLKSSLAGRWSAMGESRGRPQNDIGEDGPRELAMKLLSRNGILTREMLALESIPVSWGDLVFTLRKLEYGGTIRRGYFVRALSGEQYAMPEALEMLRAARAINPAREAPMALSAADPANPYGAMLPGCGISRDSSNVIVTRGGRVLLGLNARDLVTFEALDDESLATGVAAILKCHLKLRIDTIGGRPALESEHVSLFGTMRFHSDGRSLVYDGLPGPAPARAARKAI